MQIEADPPIPTKGAATLIASDAVSPVSSPVGHSGVIVTAKGGLALLHEGRGTGVNLDPDALLSLAFILIGVARRINRAGEEASSELDAIAARFSTVAGNA